MLGRMETPRAESLLEDIKTQLQRIGDANERTAEQTAKMLQASFVSWILQVAVIVMLVVIAVQLAK